jgi:hypothetical protein
MPVTLALEGSDKVTNLFPSELRQVLGERAFRHYVDPSTRLIDQLTFFVEKNDTLTDEVSNLENEICTLRANNKSLSDSFDHELKALKNKNLVLEQKEAEAQVYQS